MMMAKGIMVLWLLTLSVQAIPTQMAAIVFGHPYTALIHGFPGSVLFNSDFSGILSEDYYPLSSSSLGNSATTHTFTNTQFINLFNAWYVYFTVTWTSTCCVYIQHYWGVLSVDYKNIDGYYTDNSFSNPNFPFSFHATLAPYSTLQGPQTLPSGSLQTGPWGTFMNGYAGDFYPLCILVNDNNIVPSGPSGFIQKQISNLVWTGLYGGQYLGWNTPDGSHYTALISEDISSNYWFHGEYTDINNQVWPLHGTNGYLGLSGIAKCPQGGYPLSMTYAIAGNGWAANLFFNLTNLASSYAIWANNKLPLGQPGSQEVIQAIFFTQRSYGCYLSFIRPGPSQTYYASIGELSLHGFFNQANDNTPYPLDGVRIY